GIFMFKGRGIRAVFPRLPHREGNVHSHPPALRERAPGAPRGGVVVGSPNERKNEVHMPAVGKVTQVIGSTFDAEFPEDQLPGIYNALKIDASVNGSTIKLTGEVQQHLGGGRVRAVALGSTD